MKTDSSPHPKAFTIIELMIVIAIILTLATGGLAVAFSIMQRAKRMTAYAVCTELQKGIETFHTDKSALPLELAEDATISSKSPQGLELLQALLDNEYINIKEGEKGIDGLVYTDSGALKSLVDPWGGDYKIRLDGGDMDKRIEVKPKGSSKTRELNKHAAVWTDGRDGVDDTGEAKDDVKSW